MTAGHVTAVALALVLSASAAAAQTGTDCLSVDAPLYAGDTNMIHLTSAGRAVIGRIDPTVAVPVIRIDVTSYPPLPEGEPETRPTRAFHTRLSSNGRALKTNLGEGVYAATLRLARFQWPQPVATFEDLAGCDRPLTVTIREARPYGSRNSWSPTPQAYGTAGYLFLEGGLEAANLVGPLGLAAGVTWLPRDGDGRTYASALLQLTATRGFWQIGVRSRLSNAGDRDWYRPADPHPVIGFGLELPPLVRRPTWVVARLAFPAARYDAIDEWPAWRPGRWRFSKTGYDLYFGFRVDVRPVRR
jgi:hypothetical protein